MSAALPWLALSALLLSAALTAAVRALALHGRVLDVPNERSSHTSATPRGGGAAIVLVVSAAAVALGGLGLIARGACLALVGGGAAVALVGLLDDRRALPPLLRLAVHVAAAAWALAWLGGLPPLQVGAALVDLGWAGQLLALLGIVWTLNLFNFMDGIDALAGSEAMFIALGGAALTLATAPTQGLADLALVFAAACAGFLWWNWPPARIFLGDVGSGYLGYLIAVLALAATRSNPAALWVWLILGAVFFVDATVTLVRRAARGAPVHQAHRSHAYQRLARRWHSHRRVTLSVLAVNLAWLMPCALFAGRLPRYAAALVLVALVPLIALALLLGAGREEPRGT